MGRSSRYRKQNGYEFKTLKMAGSEPAKLRGKRSFRSLPALPEVPGIKR